MIQTAQQIVPVVDPRGGPPESEVTLTVTGLPPLQTIRIGFGSLSQYGVLGGGESDGDGNLTLKLKVPEWAERDRVHYWVVSPGNRLPRAFSKPFHVTSSDGTARILGTISAEGSVCLALDGPENIQYTLLGDLAGWSPGQRVLVIGTVADDAACDGQGVPIAVRQIQLF